MNLSSPAASLLTAAAVRERAHEMLAIGVAGVQDARFQQLMPDVIHWLGIRRIDRFVSMSNMKYDALLAGGIEVGERVPIPAYLVPDDASVEMEAKKAAGYFTADAVPTEDELTRVVGRDLKEF